MAKKVTVKLQEICATNTEGRAPCIESLRAVRKVSLPAKTFYWLNKISEVIEKEFTDYEQARIRLVMDVGTKTDSGYQVPPEKAEVFTKQLAELDREIELPIEEGIKLALPANGVAEDWFMLMSKLDIFEEPK